MMAIGRMAAYQAVALAARRAYAAVQDYAAGEARADALDAGVGVPLVLDRLEALYGLMDANLLLEDAADGDWWEGLEADRYWDALSAVSIGLDALLRGQPVIIQ